MKVFLSYASEDREQAELIAGSIRARGHSVFFDRTDLPVGQSYEDQIENAIDSSTIMVFLVSPNSVADGKFTRTELDFARKRWENAKGSVLPVMLYKTPIDQIPAYLRTVTILEPEGNVAAETAAAVNRLKWHGQRMFRRTALAAGVVTIGLSLIWYFTPPKPSFSVELAPPTASERGLFGKPDLFGVDMNALNTGGAAGNITETKIEAEPQGAINVHSIDQEIVTIVAPGDNYHSHFKLSLKNLPVRIRGCVYASEAEKACGYWKDWETVSDLPFPDAFEIDEKIRKDAVALAWNGSAFLVALAESKKVVLIGEDGEIIATSTLPGTPLSLSVGSLGVFVGLGAPNTVIRIDPNSLEILRKSPIVFPDDMVGAFGEPVSSRPLSMAQDNDHLWILTRGDAGAAGLAYFPADLKSLSIPPYYNDVSFDLSDMNLKNGSASVWSGRDGTAPASIHQFTVDRHFVYTGHDYGIASCASDVNQPQANKLLVPDCKGIIQEVSVDGKKLYIGSQLGKLNGYQTSTETWEIVKLNSARDSSYFATLNQRTSGPGEISPSYSVNVSLIGKNISTKSVFQTDGAQLLSMAVGQNVILLILQSDDGERQLLPLSY